ncbi:hypothetical protein PR048_011282 [Dryococelus australis]|uniref:Uncharacterized protein n=1 Tax=Dryococelus australis TaxID=614101 RepID=A0ABQ9HL66_9NEOP|nr:hypothetical protein PR048_011282 [Dryococelus australis]
MQGAEQRDSPTACPLFMGFPEREVRRQPQQREGMRWVHRHSAGQQRSLVQRWCLSLEVMYTAMLFSIRCASVLADVRWIVGNCRTLVCTGPPVGTYVLFARARSAVVNIPGSGSSRQVTGRLVCGGVASGRLYVVSFVATPTSSLLTFPFVAHAFCSHFSTSVLILRENASSMLKPRSTKWCRHDLSSANSRSSKSNTAHLLGLGTNIYTRKRGSGRLRRPMEGARVCEAELVETVLLTKFINRARLTTKANRIESPVGSLPDFFMWESCRTIQLVGKFSWGSPASPAHTFRRCSILISITLISSQNLAYKSRPNIFTHSPILIFRDGSTLVSIGLPDKLGGSPLEIAVHSPGYHFALDMLFHSLEQDGVRKTMQTSKI